MELTKNNFFVMITICFGLLSCDGNKQNNTTNKESTETIENIEKKQSNDTTKTNNKTDTLKSDSLKLEQEEKIELPDYIDYESEYQLRYEFYINKAYDKNVYEKHYQPNTYQSKHLDSLIDKYEKETSDSIVNEP